MSPEAPPAARPAATVVVLRPAASPGAAPEILMVRRSRGASFMADAFVFPGGRVDEADGVGDQALRVAAARELREEAAIEVDPATLRPLSRWVTPSAEPKRFDARFFLAVVPANTEATVDAAEVTELRWADATTLLSQQARREIKLPPPTLRTLEELAAQSSLEAILAWTAAQSVEPIQPKLVTEGDELVILLPWDPAYADASGEGAPLAAREGTTRYLLREGYFVGTRR